ncbi:MBL fold metallo-hydrolase [Nesterenkonia xinjiangensis]|uniref:Glyoxylase-like metal-dependent hydrolase (Beta-lactamase superfamily II) n=1 Tax=Nesterenkonia xinjiangensis TaxID=225327 RepID=A0A7Z0K9R0_9MICC|nr:MBL fold metallo-hydrolase [Nesterenkonia xinjiangensis]NYJ77495.1 glyoxylase-like metal-dependent hydrolase (beta-lactamase superfamily II) [Nesterenkonia xinjiangensis]
MAATPGLAPFTRVDDDVWMTTVDGGVTPLNIGLVVGTRQAVLIDPGPAEGDHRALLAAVRDVTDVELVVVNTHGHGDHIGANAFLREQGVEIILAHRDAEVATSTQLLQEGPVSLDIGGIDVVVEHLGRGHTDGDVVVVVRREGHDGIMFCGDLVREGTDPSFRDSHPMEWVRTLGRIWSMAGSFSRIIPGHGRPVDADFVASMRRRMQQGHSVSQQALRDAVNDATKAIPILPYGPEESRELITRLRAGH